MAFSRSTASLVGLVSFAVVILPLCCFGQTVDSSFERVDNLAKQLEETQAALDVARVELSELRGLRTATLPRDELLPLPSAVGEVNSREEMFGGESSLCPQCIRQRVPVASTCATHGKTSADHLPVILVLRFPENVRLSQTESNGPR